MVYRHKMIRLRTIFRSNYHIMVTWIKRIGLKLQSSMKLKWISNWTYLLVQKVSFSFSKFLCIWLYRISNVKKDFSYVNLNYLMFYDIICHHTPSKYRFIHTLYKAVLKAQSVNSNIATRMVQINIIPCWDNLLFNFTPYYPLGRWTPLFNCPQFITFE